MRITPANIVQQQSYNRTMLELKWGKFKFISIFHNSYNRTMLELKLETI